jgi:hypothetical protein
MLNKKWNITEKNSFIPMVRKQRIITSELVPWIKVKESNLVTKKELINYLYFEWSDVLYDLYSNYQYIEEISTLMDRSQKTIEFLYDPSRSGNNYIYTRRSSISKEEFASSDKEIVSWGLITIDNLNKLFIEFYEKSKGIYRYRCESNEILNKKARFKLNSIVDNKFTAEELNLKAIGNFSFLPSYNHIFAVRTSVLSFNSD